MNIDEFIDGQIKSWQQARDNYAALYDVSQKSLDVDGMTVRVQFNPARIVSSAAKVDEKSLSERKCFLCDENRPDSQQKLPWGDRYNILVNPFPIFPRHLTIPDRNHTPQRIEGRIADMVALAVDLKGYVVFYNGPMCGASAPDHMHFQAGNADFLPLSENMEKVSLQPLQVSNDGESVLSVALGLPLNMFVIDTTDARSAEQMFARLYAALPQADMEPMMNILCYVTPEDEARIIIVPRKRHRPSFYGTEGDECMLLSPASVDMGGVFITPRRNDYDRIDSDIVRKVFKELTLNDNEINEIIERL